MWSRSIVRPCSSPKKVLYGKCHNTRTVGESRTRWEEVVWRDTSLTHLLTPWSRVLLEMLTSKLCSQSRNSPHLWNPKVPHRTHKCPPPVPILSQLHPVPTTPSNFLKIHLNINLPSTSWSPQWPLSLRLPHQHPLHTSILPHTRYIPCPFYSSRFYHPHNIGQEYRSFSLLPITKANR